MSEYPDRPRWWFFAVAALVALAAGFFAYNVGVSHGAAIAAIQAPAGAPPVPYPYPYVLAPAVGVRIRPAVLHPVLLSALQRLLGMGRAMAAALVLMRRGRVMKEGPSADDSGRG